ncbi:MAG: 4-hydroxy-tetrahydrodipicolinate synthase [Bacteroidales bacterium]|nr:4-hydroxy-tetrahydrodipicolinate synthase [Bacteroidales bacterium]
MKKLTLSGCGTALLTPFCEDGSVDYAAYAASIDRQVAAGVHFLVPLGTTAETPALTPEEKVRLLKIAKDHAAGRPLLVGCGANSFEGTMANIRLLEPLGPDAFLVVVPYYNKPTPEGQYRYFKAVAAATQVPVVIYNVPGRTGANMTAATALRLAADCPNIIGIKEASGNYAQGSELIRRAPDGFAVLSGDDDLTFALMATGAKGVVSVASNIAPAEVAAMAEALLRDDIPAARALHHRLSPLYKACFLESNPIPAKAAMAQLGLMTDAVRLPLAPASDATRAALASVLEDLF